MHNPSHAVLQALLMDLRTEMGVVAAAKQSVLPPAHCQITASGLAHDLAWHTLHVRSHVCHVGIPAAEVGNVRVFCDDVRPLQDVPRIVVEGASWLWWYALDSIAQRLSNDAPARHAN